MFSLICLWINDWVNNREGGDLGRHRGHYDVNVIIQQFVQSANVTCCIYLILDAVSERIGSFRRCYLSNMYGVICMDNGYLPHITPWILSITRTVIWLCVGSIQNFFGMDHELIKAAFKAPISSVRVSFYKNLTWDWDLACIDALHRILFLYLNSGEYRLHIHDGIRKFW